MRFAIRFLLQSFNSVQIHGTQVFPWFLHKKIKALSFGKIQNVDFVQINNTTIVRCAYSINELYFGNFYSQKFVFHNLLELVFIFSV